MPQIQLPFFPHGTTEINARLGIVRDGDRITYMYGHMGIFTHHVQDIQTFRMIASQIYVNGNATQSEICRTFGVTGISVKRWVKLYREKGSAGFYDKRRTRGAAVLTESVLASAQSLLDEGMAVGSVAQRLDVKKDTMQKAVRAGRLHAEKKHFRFRFGKADNQELPERPGCRSAVGYGRNEDA